MAPFNPLNVMIGHSGASPWAVGLLDALSAFPVELHQPRTTDAVIRLVADRPMHVAVLDDELPDAGGRGVVRMMRTIGHELPCVLVCHQPTQRVLQDAIKLDVFTVCESKSDGAGIVPVVFQLVKRVYQVDWLGDPSAN